MADEFVIDIPAGEWDTDPTNYPEWEKDVGANGEMVVSKYDDTTEEYGIAQIQVPTNLTAGTVYFEQYGYALTAVPAPDIEVQFRLSHSAKTAGEDWDAAYANVESGDKDCKVVQDQLDFFEWNATVAALGWAASDHVRIMLSRSAIDAGSKLVGDYCVTHFRVRIPIA